MKVHCNARHIIPAKGRPMVKNTNHGIKIAKNVLIKNSPLNKFAGCILEKKKIKVNMKVKILLRKILNPKKSEKALLKFTNVVLFDLRILHPNQKP